MIRGIDAAAVYLPRYRLSSDEVAEAWERVEMKGIEQKAVAAADEDAVTMGVAAAERALANWDGDRTAIRGVAIGTTTPPLDEEAVPGRIVRALDLDETCETMLTTGSTHAGSSALTRGLDWTGAALVIATDTPTGDLATSDHRLGAGAAAFLVSDDAAVQCVARGSYANDHPGVRFRSPNSGEVEHVGITGYQRGAVREALQGAFAATGDVPWDDITGVALHQPDGGLPYRMASAIPVDQSSIAAGMVVGDVGDLGAATVPVGLATLLESADGLLASCAYGGGAATALVFEGSLESVPGVELIEGGQALSYARYLRIRGALGSGAVAGGGARVSLPNWQRSIPQRYRLVAGVCSACGALNFPPEGACQTCHERTDYEVTELDRTGTIAALTVIGHGGAPPEFADQQRRSGGYVAAIVSLTTPEGEVPVRIPAQVVDCDPSELSVGDSVTASFRRIYAQEGIIRYGCKFVPST